MHYLQEIIINYDFNYLHASRYQLIYASLWSRLGCPPTYYIFTWKAFLIDMFMIKFMIFLSKYAPLPLFYISVNGAIIHPVHIILEVFP